MSTLDRATCEPCSGEAAPISRERIAGLATELPEWQIVEIDGIVQLQRRFPCDDFASALAFADRVGRLAEEQGHHPALLVEYTGTTVRWWTHKVGGLHDNDFIMAAKTDRLREG